VLRLLVLL